MTQVGGTAGWGQQGKGLEVMGLVCLVEWSPGLEGL